VEAKEVKMYSDYKSPFAYLAFDPAFALEQRYRIRLRWIPFQLRIKGKGERSTYSEYKARYSYLDARRWAKPRGILIRGPLKVYDTRPALIGGLFAERHGRLLDYSRKAYELFFRREFEADQPEAVAHLLAALDYRRRNIGSISTARAPTIMIGRRKKPRLTTSSGSRCFFSIANPSGVTTGCGCSRNG
jgi:2-hydroxychromene-2-carboxylate isomerase